jgi:hypothetical protein
MKAKREVLKVIAKNGTCEGITCLNCPYENAKRCPITATIKRIGAMAILRMFKEKKKKKIHKRSKNMSGEVCSDNRFEIIEKVKNHLIESTNITKKELDVVDSILFRLWQLRYFDNVEVEE